MCVCVCVLCGVVLEHVVKLFMVRLSRSSSVNTGRRKRRICKRIIMPLVNSYDVGEGTTRGILIVLFSSKLWFDSPPLLVFPVNSYIHNFYVMKHVLYCQILSSLVRFKYIFDCWA